MAFGRVVELIVADPTELNVHKTPEAVRLGVELSGLDISFEVVRSNVFSDNTAVIKVYNANQETRTKLLREGANVLLRAGYEDQGVGTIFIGNISGPTTSERESDGTWVTTIMASSTRADDKSLQTTTVSLSYAPGTTIKSILTELANSMGLALTYGAPEIKLPNGWCHAGNIRKAFAYCNKILRSNDASLYVDNGSLIVYNLTGSSEYQVAYLDAESGLLDVSEVTPDKTDDKTKTTAKTKTTSKSKSTKMVIKPARKVKFKCLINPAITPNSVVQIESSSVKGVFVVQKATFIGDNFGDVFECACDASFFDVKVI